MGRNNKTNTDSDQNLNSKRPLSIISLLLKIYIVSTLTSTLLNAYLMHGFNVVIKLFIYNIWLTHILIRLYMKSARVI